MHWAAFGFKRRPAPTAFTVVDNVDEQTADVDKRIFIFFVEAGQASSPVATAEFSKFAGILSAELSVSSFRI